MAEVTNPFQALGGEDGVVALVRRFYGEMDRRPDAAKIRAMHKDDLEPIIDRLATYLIGWMGGPRRYGERFGSIIVPAVHQPYDIGREEAEAWLACMESALDHESIPTEWADRIMVPMRQMAAMCITRED